MSFLNLKSLLPSKNSSPESNQSHHAAGVSSPRKISCSSGSDVPTTFMAGSPDSTESSIPQITRSAEPVRLFICDRRRAIIEKIVDPSTIASSSGSDGSPSVPLNVFLTEQYVDNSGSSWAFKFDFNLWSDQFNVDEVCLQNFCSFLDRDHGKMMMDGGQRNLDQRRGHQNSNLVFDASLLGDSRSPVAPPTSGPGSSSDQLTPYQRLPSSQSANCGDPHIVLDDEACSTMKALSAGRLERLAAAMKGMSPSHVVFRDHSCYHHRPTLLLFWFLTQMRSPVSRLTFDSIQSDSQIPLHELIDFDGLDELTVIQPSERQAFSVTNELLIRWLQMKSEYTRRQLRLTLTGCKDVTARGLAQFIKGWCVTSEPLAFDAISIDISSVRPEDFLHEMEEGSPAEADWRPPTPPSSSFGLPTRQPAQNKQMTFIHRRRTAFISYRCAEGRLVLDCVNRPPKPVSAMPRASSAQSFGQYQHRSSQKLNGRGMHRNTTFSSTLSKVDSVDQPPHSSLVDRMFGFLLRSNA